MFDLFVRSWRGEESLAKAYWLVHLLFGIIIVSIVATPYFIFMPKIISPAEMYNYYINVMNDVGIICFPYSIYSAICVWRCAKNSDLLWNVLAKLFVSLNVLAGLYHLFQLIHH